jgi:two-component system chemotaxis response regulator CheB
VNALPVVAIAASAGGPSAVGEVLRGLAGVSAAIVVIQHLHAAFVAEFVRWMARVSALPVQLALDGEALRPGSVYVAQAGTHLKIDASRHILLDPWPVSLHRPSADELFRSLARHAPKNTVGVLLTGMGSDGAEGLLALRQSGGTTIVQDAASAAVFGMPGAAQRLGAADHVLPLAEIAPAIVAALARRGR